MSKYHKQWYQRRVREIEDLKVLLNIPKHWYTVEARPGSVRTRQLLVTNAKILRKYKEVKLNCQLLGKENHYSEIQEKPTPEHVALLKTECKLLKKEKVDREKQIANLVHILSSDLSILSEIKMDPGILTVQSITTYQPGSLGCKLGIISHMELLVDEFMRIRSALSETEESEARKSLRRKSEGDIIANIMVVSSNTTSEGRATLKRKKSEKKQRLVLYYNPHL
eukprot:TRINITY_DN4210_c0_g1_i2.p1 TRINITY_DN4210_c0_g1~~TRINITY_DN4210_c0_g1_i2.p1  ORF type:complete len:224 (+),score=51.69 TRINITY_DN4210_c0_g1_i2:10-681(+)